MTTPATTGVPRPRPPMTLARAARINEVIDQALAARPAARRHPAEVTADRVLGHAERWHDRLDGSERAAFSTVRDTLQRLAEEDEAEPGTGISIAIDIEPGS